MILYSQQQEIGCAYNCLQCDYLPNNYSGISSITTRYGTVSDAPAEIDPFGSTGIVKKCEGLCRIGTDQANSLTGIEQGRDYIFCVWVKSISLPPAGRFEFEISNNKQEYFLTDANGDILEFIDLDYFELRKRIETTTWKRICVNARQLQPANHRFVDMGDYGTTHLFLFAAPQLQEVTQQRSNPEPYTEGLTSSTCQKCAHYTRQGPNCSCAPGYTEVSPGSVSCQSLKPSGCEYYIRIESAGWNPTSADGSVFLNVYLNDVQIGTSGTTGITLYLLNSDDYSLISQQSYDTKTDSAQETQMVTDINALSAGQIVIVGINEDGSYLLTPAAYTALQSLGLNSETMFHYRDGFAMIGKKGALPGSTKQIRTKAMNSGRANLVACLRCSYKCSQCGLDINEMPLLDGIFESSPEPILQPSETDVYGNTGSVYRKANGYIRIGLPSESHSIQALQKGQYYQISVWVRKLSGVTLPNFNFDISNINTNRYICNEEGDILEELPETSDIQDKILETWVRLVQNIHHDTTEEYKFIDIGPSGIPGETYEYSNPKLTQIENINQPPYKHSNPTAQCVQCTHHTRILPNCDCAPGYTEQNPGDIECVAEVPDTCSKQIKIESSGLQYANGELHDHLRMYLNNVELASFTNNGLTIVTLNEVTFAIDQNQNFGTHESSFDNSLLETFINNIPNGRIILIGTKNDSSRGLNIQGYNALKSIGLDSSISQFGIRSAFSMITIKGQLAETVQKYTDFKNGGIANLVQCIEHCENQCSKCQNQSDNCTECVDLTTRKDTSLGCVCKNGHFEEGNTLCGQCDVQCEECETSSSQCTSCSHVDRDFSQGCACKKGYSQVGSTKDCIKNTCPVGCILCNQSQTECYECEEIQYFVSNSDPTLATCIQCPTNCNKCTSSSVCTECIGLNRNLSDICNPNPGYYNKLSQDDAEICVSPCQNCTSETHCLSCQGQNREGSNCDPLGGFFDKVGVVDALPCISPCLNCQSESHCDSCIDTHDLVINTCILCDSKCNGCTGLGPTNCKQCIGANRDTGNSCQCEDGYFENSSLICQKCPSICKKCSSETVCTECPSSLEDPNRTNNLPNCECKEFFEQNSEGKCQSSSCNPQKCGTCFNGPNDCVISCKESCSTCNETGDCITCNIGQYLNENICENCHSKCSICKQDSKDSCIQCSNSDENRSTNVEEDNCECKEGYYEHPDTLVCTKCQNENCKRCDQEGVCIECRKDFQVPDCNVSKKGYYPVIRTEQLDNGTHEIIIGYEKCFVRCLTCVSSKEDCGLCNNGLFRLKTSPCTCMEGYHDQNGQFKDCKKCPNMCKTCIDDSICLSCKEDQNFEQYPTDGKCICKTGHKMNQKGSCKACFQYKGDCYFTCPKNTIINENSYICEAILFQEQNITFLIYFSGLTLLLVVGVVFCIYVGCIGQYKKNSLENGKIVKRNQEQVQQ